MSRLHVTNFIPSVSEILVREKYFLFCLYHCVVNEIDFTLPGLFFDFTLPGRFFSFHILNSYLTSLSDMPYDSTDREKFSSPGMSYSLPLENLQRQPSGDTIREIVTSQQCVQTTHHTITEEADVTAEPNKGKEISEETVFKCSLQGERSD